MRAIMSLPVPLSPSINTGTFAPASFSNRSRRACMTSVRPKTTAYGCISPKGCTSEFTLPDVVIIRSRTLILCTPGQQASGNPNQTRHLAASSNLAYVVLGLQLTKDSYRGKRGNAEENDQNHKRWPSYENLFTQKN